MSSQVLTKPDNAFADLMARTWNKALPMTALWELTYACNHKCAFCYNCPERGRKELKKEEILSGLAKIADLGCIFLVLTGGEPLTRRDFFDIAWAGKRLGFSIRVYTNGYLIDEVVARKFKELMPFEIEISFHGATAETMDKLTGVPGSFDRVVRGIKFLRKYDLKVNMKCPITKWNQWEIRGIKDLAQSLGCHAEFDPVITPRDDGDTSPLALQADREFLEKLWSPEYADVTREEVPVPRDDITVNANCGTGRSTLAIDPYGNIYPCVQWRRSAGNIMEVEDLRALWLHSPVLEEVRRIAMEIPKTTLKSCESGEFCSFCPGVAEVQTGDPRNIYPQVRMTSQVKKERHSEFMAIQSRNPA
jgi:radical SAM protein with 4Fe4S-binding SPASM domain